MHPKALQMILGHNEISTTLDIYTDASNDFVTREMEKFLNLRLDPEGSVQNKAYQYLTNDLPMIGNFWQQNAVRKTDEKRLLLSVDEDVESYGRIYAKSKSSPDTQVHRQELSLETIDFIGFVDWGQECFDDNLTTI